MTTREEKKKAAAAEKRRAANEEKKRITREAAEAIVAALNEQAPIVAVMRRMERVTQLDAAERAIVMKALGDAAHKIAEPAYASYMKARNHGANPDGLNDGVDALLHLSRQLDLQAESTTTNTRTARDRL